MAKFDVVVWGATGFTGITRCAVTMCDIQACFHVRLIRAHHVQAPRALIRFDPLIISNRACR